MNTTIRTLSLALATAVLAVGVGACGSDDNETADQLAPKLGDNDAVSTQVPVFAGDPDATKEPSGVEELANLPTLQRKSETADVPAIRGSEGQDVAQWVATVNNDVAGFWQSLFNQSGLEFGPATQVLFNADTQETGCGQISAQQGPLYCSGDQTIYLPIPFFESLFGDLSKANDAAIAVIISHENGHHVQNLLGVFNGNRRSIDIELQADCLAGVWGSSVLARGALEEDDLAESLGISHAAGDPEGSREDDPGAHGNGDQRVQAYSAGFDSGDPDSCASIGEEITGGGQGGGVPGGGGTTPPDNGGGGIG